MRLTSAHGTFRTWRDVRLESAFGVKRKLDFEAVRSAFDPIETFVASFGLRREAA